METKEMTIDDLITYPVLLAGGSGTRLWPISRTQAPKQLAEFGGQRSLIQKTIQRLHPTLCLENVRVVCGKAHCDDSSEHLAAIGLKTEHKIISEPVGRNTAPAILLAVLKILDQACVQDALFFILPADHVIRDVSRFHEKILKAVDLANKGFLVTFGIQPDYPETGYGYIEGKNILPGGELSIARFVEKPDLETAKTYIKAGNFFWNSGMFAFRASTILNEFREFEPDMLTKMTAIVKEGDPISLDAYQNLQNISFDVAIMEKTSKGVVLPSDFGWSDIGTWKSLYASMPKDRNGNVIAGDVIANNTQNSLIIAKSRLLAVNDISDTAIVETPDAVFISKLETSRNVKDIVSMLKQQNRRECQVHLLETYAWGTMQYLEKSDALMVVKLLLKPRATYEMAAHQSGRLNICLTSGNAQIFHARAQHELQTGYSLTLDAQSEVEIRNVSDDELSAIITHS
jgi:mannose-1-phosphate guanylyltransferase/mannose-6-phosphate isomerase